jgi:hypothetical protein
MVIRQVNPKLARAFSPECPRKNQPTVMVLSEDNRILSPQNATELALREIDRVSGSIHTP